MNYANLIEILNTQLCDNGIKSIYTLIANDVDIDTIEKIICKNTLEYQKMSSKEKQDFSRYLKTLILETKLLSIN